MRTRTAAAVVAAAAIAIYWPALGSGFVGDDFMIVHRLRALAGPADVLRFFRGEFFEYYRPLGFVAHAIDWRLAGADPRQFHLTNILLHAVSSVLVLLIGRALSPRTIAGPVAALLFALHASNHEAVVWISARFDLLATCFSLAAVWWMVRDGAGSFVVPPLLFLCAALSKESAVALPIAAAGFAVFRLRSGTIATAWRVAPWLAALVTYSVLRHLGGGISAIGGATRIPKLAAFLFLLCALLLLAGGRWLRVRAWVRDHRATVLGGFCAGIVAMAAAAAAGGRVGQLAGEKLAVAGFALFNLFSPVIDLFEVPFYLQTGSTIYWLGGAIALAILAVVLALVWRPLLEDDRMWFLAAFLAAALLPISALTEGARYLYLPSAALSLVAGVGIGALGARKRMAALCITAVVLVVSAGQIAVKVRDWRWAGQLTADGGRLVDSTLAPSCGQGHVVFLTEPVAIRAVYPHFLYETFEMPRGCMPAVFQVLVRMVRIDTPVDVRWDNPSQLVITAPVYHDNFLLSRDLRDFDLPLRGDGTMEIVTPLGTLRAERTGPGERLTLTLSPDARREGIRFFYYSDGAIHPVK
jgi:hypothetical protein